MSAELEKAYRDIFERLKAYYENLFARMEKAVVELGDKVQEDFAALYGKLDAIGKEVEELKRGRPGEGAGGER